MPASARTASDDAVNCLALSRTRNRKPATRSPRSIRRSRICWTVQAPSGFAVNTEDVHVTAAYLYDEQAVQARQGHRAIHVEEVRGEHRRCLGMQELPPCRVGAPFRCRGNLQRLEDPADRGRADQVAELEQLALDPLVSPAVVFGGEPLDECGDLGADWRPSCAVRISPLAVTRRRCQRRTVPGVTSRCARSCVSAGAGSARRERRCRPSRGRAADWSGAARRPRAAARATRRP